MDRYIFQEELEKYFIDDFGEIRKELIKSLIRGRKIEVNADIISHHPFFDDFTRELNEDVSIYGLKVIVSFKEDGSTYIKLDYPCES